MAYSIKFVLDSWLKQSTGQGSALSDDQRQYVKAKTEIPIAGIQAADNNHLKITFGRDAQGKQIFLKGRNTWYVYGPTVQILRDGVPVSLPAQTAAPRPAPTPAPAPDTSVWVLKAIADTWLKRSPAQGSALPESERQLINQGAVLPISSYAEAPDNHLRISLGNDSQGKQLFIKGINTWYVYRGDVQILRDGKVVVSGLEPTPPKSPVYVLKVVTDTWLKQSTAQASTLTDTQRHLVQNNTVFPISSYSTIPGNHLKFALGTDKQGKQLFIKGSTTWFVFRPDVQILQDGKVILSGPEPPPTSKSGVRQINERGLQLLKKFEGLSLTAYQDPVKVWTIGYGTTAGVKPGQRITEAQAEALLKRDLRRFEAAVERLVNVPLNSNQFSALVVFTYNAGARALATSKLLRVLNQGNYQAAANELLRWNRAGGRVLAGLTRRRQAERALFLS
jgi:GH24 family phage-related lysozyme (muramidase)